MNDPTINGTPTTHPSPAPAGNPVIYTLEPLRSDGPDSLRPDASEGILAVRLREIEASWDDPFRLTVIVRSDDLFNKATTDCAPDPIPPAPHLTQATLDVQFADYAGPETVEIIPPTTLKCHHPEDTTRIIAFLSKHHFLQKPSGSQPTLLLALLLALASMAPDAQSAQTDDDDENRRQHPRAALRNK